MKIIVGSVIGVAQGILLSSLGAGFTHWEYWVSMGLMVAFSAVLAS